MILPTGVTWTSRKLQTEIANRALFLARRSLNEHRRFACFKGFEFSVKPLRDSVWSEHKLSDGHRLPSKSQVNLMLQIPDDMLKAFDDRAVDDGRDRDTIMLGALRDFLQTANRKLQTEGFRLPTDEMVAFMGLPRSAYGEARLAERRDRR